MRLDLLILARIGKLATPRRAGLAELRAIAAPGASKDEFAAALDACLAELRRSGALEPRTLRITEAGRDRLTRELGVDAVPTWAAARDHHLPALALGVKLPIKKDAIRAVVLARRLGLDVVVHDLATIVDVAIANAVGAPRGDARSVGVALIGRAIAGQPALVDREPAPPPRPPPAPPAPAPAPAPRRWTDDDLAAAVRAAARHMPAAGRFGDEKVFVSAIWRALDPDRQFPGLTIDGYKARLLDANRRGALTLARADLVGAMDPREVAASEIRHLNATFHFVLDRARP